MTQDAIGYATLAKLAAANGVRGTRIVGQPEGWGIVIRYGTTERALTWPQALYQQDSSYTPVV